LVKFLKPGLEKKHFYCWFWWYLKNKIVVAFSFIVSWSSKIHLSIKLSRKIWHKWPQIKKFTLERKLVKFSFSFFFLNCFFSYKTMFKTLDYCLQFILGATKFQFTGFQHKKSILSKCMFGTTHPTIDNMHYNTNAIFQAYMISDPKVRLFFWE
jgi:hypothetical protein